MAISRGLDSTCDLLLALRVTGRVGSSIGKDSDGAGNSWLVELCMVYSSIGGDNGSWLSCGDENKEFEDLERISHRHLRVIEV